VPVHVSPLFVGPSGQLAYVEDGRLIVVGADGQNTVVAEDGVAHDESIAWSPDGRRLLYVTGEDGEEEYHVGDGTTGETLHLDHKVPDFPPEVEGFDEYAWSPDGTHLSFRAWWPDESGVWVVDVEARSFWRVADGFKIVAATWVDTSTILYQEHHGAEVEALRLVDIAAPMELLTDTLDGVGESGFYALSPDHRYLAGIELSGEPNRRLRVAPLLGHPPLTLPTQPTVTASFDNDPLWSPDGRWIAYGALALASPDEAGMYSVVVDTTALSPTQVIAGLLPRAWSPDGRLLTGPTCPDFNCGLAVTDVFFGQVTTIASGEQVYLWDLAWSPQGTYLAYSLTGPDADLEGLVLWDRATGERRLLMPGGEDSPLTDLQWTPDGCHLYFAQRAEGESPENIGPVEAIWGLGPDWEHRWQVAPGESEGGQDDGPPPCPPSLLAGRRLIAYYGTPLGPGLGILGRNDVTVTLELLTEQTQVYRELDPDVETIPAFHMVTTIADAYAGDDEDYNHRVPHETIRHWIDGIGAAEGWSVLDVQPGHADLDTELDLIEPLLWESNVHLALDPEFIVGEEEVPGDHLGRITGPQINRVQARLDRIGRATGQRKMLVVHQFDDRMIEQKDEILDYPLVDLVWDADGFGGLWSKTEDYNQYKEEPGFEYGGLKIFYDYDEPVMTPEQVLALEPPPVLVIYQ